MVKKLISGLFIMIVVSCCNIPKQVENTKETVMTNQIDTVISKDSLVYFCKNESIPSDMYNWELISYKDENNRIRNKYLYISKLDSLQTIYTIIDENSSKIHFVKRATKFKR